MVKTILIFIYVAVTMAALTPVGFIVVLFSLAGLRRPMSVFMHWIAICWSRLLIKFIGCKLTVSGRENIPLKGANKTGGGVCFVSNHGSIFDIVLLLAYAGRPIGFVAKKELLLVPFLNIWISVLGGLFIDRVNLRKARKTINTGVARIKAGGGMIIFPEGHRSRGQGLLPFHPGSLKLESLSGANIVPVAISGSWEIFEKNYRAASGPVTIQFCKPINPADIPVTDRKLILSDRIYHIIKEALENSIIPE